MECDSMQRGDSQCETMTAIEGLDECLNLGIKCKNECGVLPVVVDLGSSNAESELKVFVPNVPI
jgi:hypothetical protein